MKSSSFIVAILQGEPIAYIWGDFGILEVREEFRKNGIGKQLVEYAMKRAIGNGRVAVSIECKPESSIPFWKKWDSNSTMKTRRHMFSKNPLICLSMACR